MFSLSFELITLLTTIFIGYVLIFYTSKISVTTIREHLPGGQAITKFKQDMPLLLQQLVDILGTPNTNPLLILNKDLDPEIWEELTSEFMLILTEALKLKELYSTADNMIECGQKINLILRNTATLKQKCFALAEKQKKQLDSIKKIPMSDEKTQRMIKSISNQLNGLTVHITPHDKLAEKLQQIETLFNNSKNSNQAEHNQYLKICFVRAQDLEAEIKALPNIHKSLAKRFNEQLVAYKKAQTRFSDLESQNKQATELEDTKNSFAATNEQIQKLQSTTCPSIDLATEAVQLIENNIVLLHQALDKLFESQEDTKTRFRKLKEIMGNSLRRLKELPKNRDTLFGERTNLLVQSLELNSVVSTNPPTWLATANKSLLQKLEPRIEQFNAAVNGLAEKSSLKKQSHK